MNITKAWLMVGLMAVVVTGLGIVGCESTKTTDNVITISPASVTLSNDWATVVFTASGVSGTNTALALPLMWSVSDPARGTIRASGGLTAIYEANTLGGNNTITVKDQGENEGIAVVIRVDPGDASPSASSSSSSSSSTPVVPVSALTVSPISPTISASETKVFALAGGTSPYYCIPQYSALGDISSINNYNKTVVYVASGVGTNRLTFTDSSSPVMSVTATVIQQ